MQLLAWVTAHFVEILAVLGSLNLAAQGIARLTPTEADDKLVAKLGGWLGWLGSLGLKSRK
jgi:hypothetical protein